MLPQSKSDSHGALLFPRIHVYLLSFSNSNILQQLSHESLKVKCFEQKSSFFVLLFTTFVTMKEILLATRSTYATLITMILIIRDLDINQ